jgi:hypothetical protein
MQCEEFISSYSSYRDGLLDPEREKRFEDHLSACESCARYDRVVRKGTQVLRDLPRTEPSPDFLDRLRHRIYHVRDGIPLTAERGGPAVVAVAAMGLLAFAWLPFATQMSVEVELPAVAVEEPSRSALTGGSNEGDATAQGPDEPPRFLEPGVLVGADRPGAAPGWYHGVFWPRTGRGMTPGLPGRGAGPSFLATSAPSAASGR